MATKVLMPKLSDTMSEGVILKWRYKEGDKVKQGETLVEIESDKADMELEAYDSGILRKIMVPEGGKAAIGAPIAVIAEANEDITSLLTSTETSPPAATAESATTGVKIEHAEPNLTPPVPTDTRVKASPLAKKLAQDRKINLASVHGSGPQGRVVKRDVESLSPTTKTTARPAPVVYPPVTAGTAQDVELSPIRKTIALRMAQSKQTVPHFYVTMEVDMEPAMAFRDQLNSALENRKISFTDILAKACATTLMKHPQVNATYLGDKMRQYGYAHIAVAVALEEGLVTPVLRNCEQKTIVRINDELGDLVERARNRKLKPEEYAGGTFTISNLGMFGVEEFVAIVNPPEAAILAVGGIVEKPMIKKGQIAIGHTMKITLSSDHRVIDGAVAARFLQDLKMALENPVSLLL